MVNFSMPRKSSENLEKNTDFFYKNILILRKFGKNPDFSKTLITLKNPLKHLKLGKI